MGTWEKQGSRTSRDVFLRCFCTGDFRAPLIRLGDGSLLPMFEINSNIFGFLELIGVDTMIVETEGSFRPREEKSFIGHKRHEKETLSPLCKETQN